MSQAEQTRRAQRFSQLLHANHRELFAFIYALVQHHADAEDIYQQAALVLWSKFDEFMPGTNFAAWATRVAHLTTKNFLRTKRQRSVYFSDQLLDSIAGAFRPTGEDYAAIRSDALAQCLEKLSRRERRLVERCYAKDRNMEDIALAEGRSVAALYQAICRVRKNLFRCVSRTLAVENR